MRSTYSVQIIKIRRINMVHVLNERVEIRFGDQTIITIDPGSGNITMGGNGRDGDLLIQNKDGKRTFWLDGDEQNLKIQRPDGTVFVELGKHGNLTLGGGGLDGDIILRKSDGKDVVHIDAEQANLWLGGNGDDGDIVLFPTSATNINDPDQATVWLDAQHGNLLLGGNGVDGDVVLFPSDTIIDHINFEGASIHLDGDSGDIILRNADCAEDFDIVDGEQAEPGTVMAIRNDGRLGISTQAYDRRVFGVISGAGDYKPGIILDRNASRFANGIRQPIAMVGKVYCKVDANFGAIRAGDLLTTSENMGHAMKASDTQRAFGAVLGKAMKGFAHGQGMIPILVNLQ
jgi:hypothetical protein